LLVEAMLWAALVTKEFCGHTGWRKGIFWKQLLVLYKVSIAFVVAQLGNENGKIQDFG